MREHYCRKTTRCCSLRACRLLLAHQPVPHFFPSRPRRLLLPNSNGAHPLYGFRAGAWQLLCILGYIYDDCERCYVYCA